MNFNDPVHHDLPVGERAARRRRARNSGRRSVWLIALVSVLAVALIAGAAWMIHRGAGDTSAAPTGPTRVRSAAGAANPAGSAEPSGRSSSSRSSTTGPAAPEGFTACRTEVTRADALVAAGATVADDWAAHTSSLTRLDTGRITQAEADATWKRTRLAGPSDMQRYRAASAAYTRSKGACARMGALPDAFVRAAARCKQRANADSNVAVQVAPVSVAWASHLTSMKAKTDTPVGRYMRKWHQQVQDAPTILSAYRTAASAVRASPTCPEA